MTIKIIVNLLTHQNCINLRNYDIFHFINTLPQEWHKVESLKSIVNTLYSLRNSHFSFANLGNINNENKDLRIANIMTCDVTNKNVM